MRVDLTSEALRAQAVRAIKALPRPWKVVRPVTAREDPLSRILLFDEAHNKQLKTPGGSLYQFAGNQSLFAGLVALEWSRDDRPAVLGHHFPLSELVVDAIDLYATRDDDGRPKAPWLPGHEGLTKKVSDYLCTDTVCYEAGEGNTVWQRLREWFSRTTGIPVDVHSTLVGRSTLSEEQHVRLEGYLSRLSPLQFAAMLRATEASKSFIASLALLSHEIDGAIATRASLSEVDEQTSSWGVVQESHTIARHDIGRTMAACSLACAERPLPTFP